jgi:hypothetical protein
MNMTCGGRLLIRLSRARRAGPAVAAMVAVILAAAGCGDSSSSPPPAGHSAGAGKAHSTGSIRLVQFAKCMRSHGLTNFPDPTAQGTFSLPKGMTGTSQFQSADQACRSLAPAGSLSGQGPTAQELSKALRFAKCMQKHGVPNFPDPAANGHFQGFSGGGTPVDLTTPQAKSAMSACRSLLPPGSGMNTGG